MLWAEEVNQIAVQANLYGVDALFVQTIRKVENGGDGRQFGILSKKAPTYADQLRICCATVQARLFAYSQNPFKLQQVTSQRARLRYTESFIIWFGSLYAPIGAENDPEGINKNWVSNALDVYTKLIDNLF